MRLNPNLRWLRNAWRSDGDHQAKVTHGAYRAVFDATRPEGRRVLDDLAKYCNVESSSFVPKDADQTSFNEGQRDVFLHICGILGVHAVDFVLPTPREGD